MSNPPVTLMLQAAESSPCEPYQDSDSAATRHLRAGVYVDDRSFHDLVIRKVHNNSQRQVVPSYGFDLVPVGRHAWWSWFLHTGLQVAIVGCLALGSRRRLAVALVLCVILVCLMLRVVARIIAETFRAQVAAVENWFEQHKFPDTSEDSRVTVPEYSSTRNSRFSVQLPPEKVPWIQPARKPDFKGLTITATERAISCISMTGLLNWLEGGMTGFSPPRTPQHARGAGRSPAR